MIIFFNRLKWILKILFLFFLNPLKFMKYNFDYSFLNALFENKKMINQNINYFEPLNSVNIEEIDFEYETQLSINCSGHLNNSINKEYFTNLNNYGYGFKIISDAKYKHIKQLAKFHLYPANVFALYEIRNLINQQLISNGLIVDYPSGIGNLFIYLQKFVNKKYFVGIDNFVQISKNHVFEYQKSTGLNLDILTFEELIQTKDINNVELVVSIELNLDLILENIIFLNPKFLIVETFYISRYKKLKEILKTKYDIFKINESIIVFQNKFKTN